MTYDEIVEMCQDGLHETNFTFASRALMAVVQLHKPAKSRLSEWLGCSGCGYDIGWSDWSEVWPCQTIEVIVKESL